MRRFAKHITEALLVETGVEALALRRHRGRTLVLAYHNVIPAGGGSAGDRSLHLPQAAFASQLDVLSATHEVIALAAIYEKPRGVRPRAVITFDDAYSGALSVGIGELEQRNLPATVFVAPGLFGTATWWDRLAELAGGAVPPALREQALRDHAGCTQQVLGAYPPGVASLPPWAGIATEGEVRAAAAKPGITLGAHTWNHPNLTMLGAAHLAAELERPLAWLRNLGDRALSWLAYPYGLTSPAVARAAADAGYVGALRIDGGWMPGAYPPPAMRYDLPRLNVPSGLSIAGFRLRVAGLL